MAKVSINIKKGSLKKSKTIVGIDLGTTNSLVAYINQDTKNPEVIGGIVPSVIQYIKDSQWTVGELAKQQLSVDPCKTIYSVKRLLGKNYKDLDLDKIAYSILDNKNEDGLVKIEIENKYFNPIELSSIILKELKDNAEKALKTEINQAVITVPAYFNDAQRQATRDAGKLAGINVLRIVNEPTAASLAYGLGLDKNEEKTIAVYDLGGGTFDISILRIQSGVFEVLATNGDTYLGGDDIDWAIIDYWQKQHLGVNQIGKKYVHQLRVIAENCKMHLSENKVFNSEILGTKLSLNQTEFKEICQPIFDKTIEKCTLVLKDAEISKQEIDEIILVGGSTKNIFLREEIKTFFGKELNISQNPDTVVALGAAIEADILAGNRKDLLLLDVTPLSLGIETLGGLMDTIITRNSKIPNIAGRDYTTSVDGQVNLQINVFQGERELVSKNRKLASFVLKNIPSMPAGMPKINVTFMLDADGILKVKAMEKRSNTVQEVEVKPSYGLTDTEVENMLLSSIKNAKADIKTRLLIEAKGEADQVVYITEQFLKKNKVHLTAEEVEQTKTLMINVQKELKTESKDAIHSALDTLNNYTQDFAQRIMNISIKESLQGKSIE